MVIWLLLRLILIALSSYNSQVFFTSSSSVTPWKKFRYISRVSYDGTRFKGWQDNGIEGKNLNTVQAILKLKLSERLGASINVVGASRTDAGVHARGQVIHFDTPKLIENISKFEYTINRLLPDDIRMFNVSISPGGSPNDEIKMNLFHSTKYATGKYYSYTFCTNKIIDPTLRRYCGHIYFPIDISIFEKCLALFVGTYDFSSFAHKVEFRRREFKSRNFEFSTIKTIQSAELISLPYHSGHGGDSSNSSSNSNSGYYRVDIRLNSALYHMVRNIIWTCAFAAGGLTSLHEVKAMLGPRLEMTHSDVSALLCFSDISDDCLSDDEDDDSNTINNTNGNTNDSELLVAESVEIATRERAPHLARPAPPEGLCLEHVYYDDY